MQDFSRPKYFSPFEAADYGLIDQVGVVGQLWQACKCLCVLGGGVKTGVSFFAGPAFFGEIGRNILKLENC